MASKMWIAVVMVLIAVAACIGAMNFLSGASRANQATTVTGTSQTDTLAAQASSTIAEQYSALVQEQLDSMSASQPNVSQAQDSMASDLSQFYYS